MVRYLAEPRNILAEPLGSAEPRLKNTAVQDNWPGTGAVKGGWTLGMKSSFMV